MGCFPETCHRPDSNRRKLTCAYNCSTAAAGDAGAATHFRKGTTREQRKLPFPSWPVQLPHKEQLATAMYCLEHKSSRRLLYAAGGGGDDGFQRTWCRAIPLERQPADWAIAGKAREEQASPIAPAQILSSAPPSNQPSPATTAAADLCLDALRVVLNDHNNDGKKWIASTVNLQLVSLQFCIACRRTQQYHVRVPWGTPEWMWGPALSHRASQVLERCARSSRSRNLTIDTDRHIPVLQVRGMTWGLSTLRDVFLKQNKVVLGLETLIFGDHFNDDLSDVVWPSGLQRLAFGRGFNQRIERVTWPPSLRDLAFGTWFNRSLDGTALPASLQQLSFGDLFNKPIQDVQWPQSLRRLSLGFCFDRPIAQVRWPVSLLELSFGHNFDRDISAVAWPPSLQHLSFGHQFNQSIAEVKWPSSLQRLSFGRRFDQPVDQVEWPEFLQELTFGYGFNQDLDKARLPASLRQLTLGDTFDRPLHQVTWPRRLEVIVLRFRLDCSLEGVRWPEGLKKLVLRAGVTNFSDLVVPQGTTISTFR